MLIFEKGEKGGNLRAFITFKLPFIKLYDLALNSAVVKVLPV